MSNCLIEPGKLLRFDFGAAHPFKIHRLGLAYSLMEAYGLTDGEAVYTLSPCKATEQEASSFHTTAYLEVLRLADGGMWVPNLFSHGLGTEDNPVFPGVYEWAMLVAGGSIAGAKEILAGRAKVAFNFSGGLHHAMPSRASGFCHVNDVVLAINTLLEAGKRVVYIDIDAHHGDGVQYAFYEMDSVLTISIHQSGYTIFPGTGFVQEIGKGKGEGFSVNVPLLPGAGDDAYSLVWDEIVFPLINSFDPDVLVTQLGADALSNDRIARLDMSLSCFEGFVDLVYRLKKPWLAVGGGGYAVENVVRAWTLAWARMNGVTLPDEIPENWLSKAGTEGLRMESLRGKAAPVPSSGPVLNDLNRTIEALHGAVFPIIENSTARRSN